MRFGCSECLCIAIESHRPSLLKSLLQRTDIEYRDIFWAPTPLNWVEYKTIYNVDIKIPVLHHIQLESDLSFVGHDDCGHMRVDVELESSFDVLSNPNAYILVSLPLMARWHSSERFKAERILRQSGQFDYSAPQFYHLLKSQLYLQYRCSGPLKLPFERAFSLICEYENQLDSLSVSSDSNITAIALRKRSTLPPALVTVTGKFDDVEMRLDKCYGTVSRLFSYVYNMRYDAESRLSSFRDELERALRSGADLNSSMFGRKINFLKYSENLRFFRFDIATQFEVLAPLTKRISFRDEFESIVEYFKFILRNGLSFFYDCLPHRIQTDGFSLIKLFDHTRDDSVVERRIAEQLLALGYGRRELHPGDLPVREEKLVIMKILIRLQYYSNEARALLPLVNEFDAGPLSLQRLSRIAIRRSVGGVFFARHIRAIADRLPPPLFEYVAEAKEMLSNL